MGKQDDASHLSGEGASASPHNIGKNTRRVPSGPRRKKNPLGGSCRFSVLVSTENNNRIDDLQFYGPYAHIRKTLDYEYHSNYRMERQWLQDAIIEEFLESVLLTDVNGDICTTPTNPFIVFTAGAMGAGKSHTINWLVEKGLFPLLSFVGVDPDEIRRRLPEYSLYAKLYPEKAGELTRKESGYIAEILTLAALQAGKNVLVDGSLRDSDWYTQYFARLRMEYPNNNIAILHVVAPRDAVFQRAAERARRTGRVVPRETLELALEQVPKSVKILAPLVDHFYELENAPGKDIQLLAEGEEWADFQVQWLQTCAWVPGKKKKTFGSRHQSSESLDEGDKNEQTNDNTFAEEAKKRFSAAAIRASLRGGHIDRQYDLTLSTEENHQSNSSIFYGPFSHIRKALDYTYYKNYCKERQWLQDMIIKEVMSTELNKKPIHTPEPWLIFAAGGMGAGKIHAVKQLAKKGVLSLSGLTIFDYEKVRNYLPEFALYADQCPKVADNMTLKEVRYISAIVTLATLQAGKNVVVAGTMEDVDWYEKKLFPRIRRDFPNFRLAILDIVAPMQDMLSRAEEISVETGLEVSQEKLESQLVQVQRSVEALAPMVDYYCKIDNSQGVDLTILSEGETWDTFQSKWR